MSSPKMRTAPDCRNVESRQQSEQRGLARSRRTDDRHRFAGAMLQVDIIENRQAARRILHDLAEASRLHRDVLHWLLVLRGRLADSCSLSASHLLRCLCARPRGARAQGAPAARSDTAAHVLSILVLGDSLSAEYGLPRGAGWVQLLSERLRSSGADYTVVNASISGETTSGGRTRLPALLQQHRPAVVVLELGANDGLRGLPLTCHARQSRCR